jgi:hypothetical protein
MRAAARPISKAGCACRFVDKLVPIWYPKAESRLRGAAGGTKENPLISSGFLHAAERSRTSTALAGHKAPNLARSSATEIGDSPGSNQSIDRALNHKVLDIVAGDRGGGIPLANTVSGTPARLATSLKLVPV